MVTSSLETFVLPERENDVEEADAIVKVRYQRKTLAVSQPENTADNLYSGFWYIAARRLRWLVVIGKGCQGLLPTAKSGRPEKGKGARAVGPERTIRRDKSVPTPNGRIERP